jgi:hypothetical protein
LPPDDRSYGYERGIAVSPEWDQSTTAAAVEFADVAFRELWPHYQRRHRSEAAKGRERLRGFLTRIGETAFRRPLTEQQQKVYIDAQLQAEPDDAEAVKRVMLLSLKSPWFLYPAIQEGMSTSEQVASQLALTLFDSLPADEELIDAARGDRLATEQNVREIAEEFLDDYRVRAKTLDFLHGWLNVGHFGELGKDDQQFPNFDKALVADLRGSLDAFLEQVVWSESSDYRDLFLANSSLTTRHMADYYGDDWQPREDLSDVEYLVPSVESELHAGVLTHPYLMSGLAYHDATSPIHRGVFLIRYMLGRLLKPPAEAFAPLSPDLHPDLTTRERVELQTSPESCQLCHQKINALGFALENFDPIGRYRDDERGKVIDASGSYVTRAGELVKFSGYRDLAEFLAHSDDAQRAFVSRAFQHFVKQPPAAYGSDTLEKLTDSFRQNNLNIRQLLVEICVVATRPVLEESQSRVASR